MSRTYRAQTNLKELTYVPRITGQDLRRQSKRLALDVARAEAKAKRDAR